MRESEELPGGFQDFLSGLTQYQSGKSLMSTYHVPLTIQLKTSILLFLLLPPSQIIDCRLYLKHLTFLFSN